MKQFLAQFSKNAFYAAMLGRLKWNEYKLRYQAHVNTKKEEMLYFLLEKDDTKSLAKFLSLLSDNDILTQRLREPKNWTIDNPPTTLPIMVEAKSASALQLLVDFGCVKNHEGYAEVYKKTLKKNDYKLLTCFLKNNINNTSLEQSFFYLCSHIFSNYAVKDKSSEAIEYLKFLISKGLELNPTTSYSEPVLNTLASWTHNLPYYMTELQLEDYENNLQNWLQVLIPAGADINLVSAYRPTFLSTMIDHKNTRLFDAIINYYHKEPAVLLGWRQELLANYPIETVSDYVDKLTPYFIEEEKKTLESVLIITPPTSTNKKPIVKI